MAGGKNLDIETFEEKQMNLREKPTQQKNETENVERIGFVG